MCVNSLFSVAGIPKSIAVYHFIRVLSSHEGQTDVNFATDEECGVAVWAYLALRISSMAKL